MEQDSVFSESHSLVHSKSPEIIQREILTIVATRFILDRTILRRPSEPSGTDSSGTDSDSEYEARQLEDRFDIIYNFVWRLLTDTPLLGEEVFFAALMVLERMLKFHPEIFVLNATHYISMCKFYFLSAYVFGINILAAQEVRASKASELTFDRILWKKIQKRIWDSAFFFDVYDGFLVDILTETNEASMFKLLDGDLELSNKMLGRFKKQVLNDFGNGPKQQYRAYPWSFVTERPIPASGKKKFVFEFDFPTDPFH